MYLCICEFVEYFCLFVWGVGCLVRLLVFVDLFVYVVRVACVTCNTRCWFV